MRDREIQEREKREIRERLKRDYREKSLKMADDLTRARASARDSQIL